MFDTRDSTINAYRGLYLNASYRFYPQWLDATRDAQLLYVEARSYVSLSADVPRNVLAFWVLAQGVTSGKLPYLALPSIGWDFAGSHRPRLRAGTLPGHRRDVRRGGVSLPHHR